jgi:hypothetical protein
VKIAMLEEETPATNCRHRDCLVMSPLSFQWSSLGVMLSGKCRNCGDVGMFLPAESIKTHWPGMPRHNTDNDPGGYPKLP